MPRYLEDFHAGDAFTSPPITVREDDVLRFAGEFDPQPFHLDSEAAAASFFGELVGSGWHTAALTMRLLTQTGMEPGWGYVGASIEELRWPRAMKPDDVLRVHVEVTEVKASRSKPDRGFVRMRVRTLRADGEPVQELIVNMLVPTAPA